MKAIFLHLSHCCRWHWTWKHNETSLLATLKCQCCVSLESGSDVSAVGYKQQLVRCHDIEKGVIALVSLFYACHIQFATKRSSFMHLLQRREMNYWEASFAADAKSEYVTFVKSASQDCISPGLWIAYCLYCCMLIVWKTHRVCHTFCC